MKITYIKEILPSTAIRHTVAIDSQLVGCSTRRSFDTKEEADACLEGLQMARIICSNLVQEFPIGHTNMVLDKSPK